LGLGLRTEGVHALTPGLPNFWRPALLVGISQEDIQSIKADTPQRVNYATIFNFQHELIADFFSNQCDSWFSTNDLSASSAVFCLQVEQARVY
jgi:hypothetical protein